MKKLTIYISLILSSFMATAQTLDTKYSIKIEIVPGAELASIAIPKLENVDSIFLGILTDDDYTEEEGDHYAFSLYKLKNTTGTQMVRLPDVLRTDGVDSLYTFHPVVYSNNSIQYPKRIRSSYGESPAEVYPLCFTDRMLDEFRGKQISIKASK